MTSGELSQRFSCSWPTTTRHLGILEQAGLVRVQKLGRERRYQLNHILLKEVAGEWIGRFA